MLRVPSSGNSGSIYLINPDHPDFHLIAIDQQDLEMVGIAESSAIKADHSEVSHKTILRDITWSGLVDLEGRPLSARAQQKVSIDVRNLAAETLSYLRDRPELLRDLTPRAFEEFMAAFYESKGWKAQLTPSSRDGGKDVIISKTDEGGRRMCYVECKRYEPQNPVSVGVIRQLYGVVEADKATAGIVATTSFFTKPAMAEARAIGHRMTLLDFDSLADMLRPE